jgi:hypothetical protein
MAFAHPAKQNLESSKNALFGAEILICHRFTAEARIHDDGSGLPRRFTFLQPPDLFDIVRPCSFLAHLSGVTSRQTRVRIRADGWI